MNNSEFKKFQKDFTEIVLSGETSNQSHQMRPLKSIPTDKAIEVYHEDYFARLGNVVFDSFKGVSKELGQEKMSLLINQYLREYRSTYDNLDDVTDQFIFFLTKSPLIRKYPYIIDLAHFEQAIDDLHRCSECNGISSEKLLSLGGLDEDHFKVSWSLEKSYTLLSSSYDIYDLWYELTVNDRSKVDVALKESYYLLYKSNEGVHVKALDSNEFELISLIGQNMHLENCFDLVSNLSQENVSSVFQLLFSAKLVTRFNDDDSELVH